MLDHFGSYSELLHTKIVDHEATSRSTAHLATALRPFQYSATLYSGMSNATTFVRNHITMYGMHMTAARGQIMGIFHGIFHDTCKALR